MLAVAAGVVAGGVVAVTVTVVLAGSGAGDDFWRKVCVVSRNRVRSTFFFFFGEGGVYDA
jgi:hypothetical protein